MKVLRPLLLLTFAQITFCTTHDPVQAARYLYLDLIKNTLLNTIYEPAAYKEDNASWQTYGNCWPKTAHTMIGKKRMNNIQYCMEDILKNNIPGDCIETGVWRGGAVIFMRAILKAYGDTTRIVWCADSFEGLPAPDAAHYPIDATSTLHTFDGLRVSLDQVRSNFKAYGLLDSQVRFIKGFFKDTMPCCPVKQLAILRLDGDMYESTIQVLEALYDKLFVGGYCIIDDYSLPGARAATHDFRKAHNITEPIIDIDGEGAYWKKEK